VSGLENKTIKQRFTDTDSVKYLVICMAWYEIIDIKLVLFLNNFLQNLPVFFLLFIQNAMGEKEARKKSREKGEKQRKMDKEKKEREIARFQEEVVLDVGWYCTTIVGWRRPACFCSRQNLRLLCKQINALLEENQDPKKPNKKQNKVYVPALTGTVKVRILKTAGNFTFDFLSNLHVDI